MKMPPSQFALLAAAGIFVFVSVILQAAAVPSWWAERGVLSTNAVNDFAAVNQGQLKWMATNACEELEATLPSGAGYNIWALISSFSNTNNYRPVNLGQLKFVAQPFYDRLIEIGYTTNYPWSGPTNAANDFALANIGQMKNVFSFDVAQWLRQDSDSDGMTNGWELAHGLNLHTNDASWVSTDPWAHGLSNWLVYQNPSVLISNNYSSLQDGVPDWWKLTYGYATNTQASTTGTNGLTLAQNYLYGKSPLAAELDVIVNGNSEWTTNRAAVEVLPLTREYPWLLVSDNITMTNATMLSIWTTNAWSCAVPGTNDCRTMLYFQFATASTNAVGPLLPRFIGVDTCRAPLHYAPDTTVLLTFSNVEASISLSNLTYRGETAIVETNATGGTNVSFMVPMPGGSEFTINKDSFGWPDAFQPTVTTTNWTDFSEDENYTYLTLGSASTAARWLRFSGFYNERIKIMEHVVGMAPNDDASISASAGKLGCAYTHYNDGEWTARYPAIAVPWGWVEMLEDISNLGRWSVYIYRGHGAVVNGFAEVAGYTGISTNWFVGIENNPGYYRDFWGTWRVAYEYRLSTMAENFKTGKGMPGIVIILACDVETDDRWRSAFRDAGAKLVIRTGGKGEAGVQQKALRRFFETLAGNGNIEAALTEGNKEIETWNINHPANQGVLMTPFYGVGTFGNSKFKDIFKK